jgi:CheY-like chemotaxis protein
MGAVVSVALLDDHPAVLAGLRRLIEPQPDLTVIAAAPTVAELSQQLDGAGADVLVLDYDHARSNGLSLCQRIKRRKSRNERARYSRSPPPRTNDATIGRRVSDRRRPVVDPRRALLRPC